jgi:hypothetical protein
MLSLQDLAIKALKKYASLVHFRLFSPTFFRKKTDGLMVDFLFGYGGYKDKGMKLIIITLSSTVFKH